MSKKRESSPGTDAKELLLAKMLQNANARGLGWCKFTKYADPNGDGTVLERAVSCCALGAAELEPDSVADLTSKFFISYGNDTSRSDWSGMPGYSILGQNDYEDVGHAFKVAMTVDE